MNLTDPYPAARRDSLEEDLHGTLVADPYRWLEDASSAETVRWSQSQDALYAAYRSVAPEGLEDRFRGRLTELLGAGYVGTPVWRGRRRFSSRRAGDAEHAVVEVVDDGDAPAGSPRTLVDPMVLDPAGTTTLDAWQPSVEGDLLAYQVSTGGTEESVLHVIDVATGESVDGPIDRARYSPVAWLPGAGSFFYVRRLDPALVPPDEQQYHRRVWWHRVGTDTADDVQVFGEGLDRTTYFGLHVSRDGRWLVVSASAGTAPRTEVWICDLAATGPQELEPVPVTVGLDAETAAWVGRDGRLYLHTDLDAPRGRLAVTDPLRPGPEHWTTLLAQDAEAVLADVVLLDEGDAPADAPAAVEPSEIVALWRRHAVSEVTVHDPRSGERLAGEAGRVDLPGLGTVGGLVRRPTGGRELWFSYTDHTTPTQIHHVDTRTGAVSLWATPPDRPATLPAVHSEQVAFRSADGTTVRMIVLARADTVVDGHPVAPAPTVLYGYGGFQISLEPAYSATALAWVEAGGVHVVANLRGGGEEGEDWHRAGMRAHKQNVFDDFHAAAEHLVAHGWTTPDRLAVWGGSNGGLLVGAAVTQRPDLFAAAVCSAPLLDMVRYQHFGLGVTWTEEYGDAADPEELGWLLGYSPYHRALTSTDQRPAYPAVLFTVFEGDTRVDPLHARKLCAALQHSTSGSPEVSPVLLRRETGVGHGGRSLSRTIGLSAEQLSFVARQTGLVGTDGGERG
ncbi:prolyl oligopeptidase family protein [Actinotalea sp. K2]|uniref:prolyl oligopeptidase family serine peptidase n=1 Tax=Actinotalea sp. K2 TaxID=2939438 RepID=UPI00201781B4|nr:prolyl oligopeptidase family serine peptidase [Actinotalea sp. K2]MCL3860329.1 prolyl oligopeptidase family serine peptidase [Actinotalea sp. K2]